MNALERLKRDYLSGAPSLTPFYRFSPQMPEHPVIIQERLKKKLNRELLADELTAQNAELPNNQLTLYNINLLRDPQTLCVTTGQQAGLFTGPLYTIYKALTVILLTESLAQKYPQINIAPIFWIASEDHDFIEVNHCHLSYHDKITYNGQFNGAVGRHIITDAIHELTKQAGELAQFYTVGASWTKAFKNAMHYLFGQYGLIFMDPDSERFKTQFTDIMKRDIVSGASYRLIKETDLQLEQFGYPSQAHARQVNFFNLSPSARNLIEFDGEHYRIHRSKTVFSKEQISNYIERKPQEFSPNALMRPLYQETLLPNIAYVGGWSELAYWLQLRSVFAEYDVFYPLLYPRLSGLLVPDNYQEKLKSYELTLENLTLPDHELKRMLARKLWNADMISAKEESLETVYNDLRLELLNLAPSQVRNLKGHWHKTQNFLNRLTLNIDKSLLNQRPESYLPLLRLKNAVQPDGYIQERKLNILAFAQTNLPEFVNKLKRQMQLNNFNSQVWTY